ncbi:ABC transporter substrate-binding protein [Pseudonocardia sp. DLS-67]
MVQLRPRPSRVLRYLVAAAGALVLASCGTADLGPGPGAGDTQLGAVQPWGADLAAEGAPQPGGSLRIGMDRAVSSFDPTVQNTNPVAVAVYDSLMMLTPEGTARPYLAESMSSPDSGVTWRLGLREGVRFADGNPLDAEAVIINVQRHIDTVSSPAHIFAKRIVSMSAPDPLTVEFVLDGSLGSFPILFALPMSWGALGMIMSPAAIEQYGDDVGRHPVGAGPFRLVEWSPGSNALLERNPNYWQPGMPYLDEIEFLPLSDTDSRYASIDNGDVDVILAAYSQELVRALRDPSLTVYYSPGNAGDLMYFNVTRAPFDDRRMREAVVRALDLRALSASLYSNQLVTSQSLFEPGNPFHSDAATQAWPQADPERARQLVDEYRAEGGTTSVTVKSTTARGQFGELIQAQLAAVGIDVEVQLYDLAQYSAEVVQSGDFDLTTTVSSFDSPFPAVQRLLGTGGSANYGRYSDPEVDALLATAASTADEAERTAAYRQVERIVNEDLAVCWISRGYISTITRNHVRGVVRYPNRDMFYATLWRADV